MKLRGKINNFEYHHKDKLGYIAPDDKSVASSIGFNIRGIGHKFDILFGRGDIVEFEYQKNPSDPLKLIAKNIKLIGMENVSLDNWGLAVKIVRANDYMAITQMRSPHIRDFKGYANDTYARGYRLGQHWRDTSSSNYGVRRLILRSMSATLAMYMNTQLHKASTKAPAQYLFDWDELNHYCNGYNQDSISKARGDTIKDFSDKMLHAASRAMDDFSVKPMSIMKRVDSEGKDIGVILSSTVKDALMPIVGSRDEIRLVYGVNVVYFDRVDAKKAVNFYLDNKQLFPLSTLKLSKDVPWLVSKYTPERLGEISSEQDARSQNHVTLRKQY